MKLVLTAAAETDLKRIAEFSRRNWGEVVKRRTMALIATRLTALRFNPELGPLRPEVDAITRSLVAGVHVIFYRVDVGSIVIRRVLHGAMDVPWHLDGID